MGVVSIVFTCCSAPCQPQPVDGAPIGSVGLMIAFYYGLTGFACVVLPQGPHKVRPRPDDEGVVPLLGALILTAVFVYGLIQYAKPDWLTDDDGNNVTILGYGAVAVVGIGALALGLVAMAVWWIASPAYFHGHTLPRRSSVDLVLAPPVNVEPMFGLPDSGDMPTVIAPDLSNLPPGADRDQSETGGVHQGGPAPRLSAA